MQLETKLGWLKKILALAIVLEMICIINGCSFGEKNISEEEKMYNIEKVGEKLQKDEIFLVAENINYHFGANVGGVSGIQLECISREKMDEDELSVDIKGIATPYKVKLVKVENEELDMFLFAEYCEANWNDLNKIMYEDIKQYEKIMKNYETNLLEQKNKGLETKLYHYLIVIEFQYLSPENGITESFEQVNVCYKEKKHEMNIGKVIIDYDMEYKSGNALEVENVGACDIPIWKNSNGEMSCDLQSAFMSLYDITINNIQLMEEYNQLKECDVSVASGNKSVSYKMENDDINIEKGSTIGLNVKIENEQMKDKFYCQNNSYVFVNYEFENKNYQAMTELCFRTRYTAYELYAYYLDNMDLEEYLNFVYGE